jgi:uncharacterized protein YbjQ (UPF0145 family)
MTPAELLIAKTHGVRPIATVSGNCWMKITFGAQWFGLAQGHAEGWQTALARLEQEAIAAGADAVVDLRLTSHGRHSTGGVEFAVIGTAVRIIGMPAHDRPVLASVPALEFVRMVDSGIVPTGIAIGVSSDVLGAVYSGISSARYGSNSYGSWAGYSAAQRIGWQSQSWISQPIPELTDFWERIRREAISDLRSAASARGNGVLAHAHKSRLIRLEQDKQPPAWIGEHIIIGTTVDASQYRKLEFDIAPVVDLCEPSPLQTQKTRRNNVYPQTEETFEL